MFNLIPCGKRIPGIFLMAGDDVGKLGPLILLILRLQPTALPTFKTKSFSQVFLINEEPKDKNSYILADSVFFCECFKGETFYSHLAFNPQMLHSAVFLRVGVCLRRKS